MISDLGNRLFDRAISYEKSGPSAAHTASLLREAALAIMELEGIVDEECRRAEKAHGMTLRQSLELEQLGGAARAVVDECSPNAGPSNGSVDRLRAMLKQGHACPIADRHYAEAAAWIQAAQERDGNNGALITNQTKEIRELQDALEGWKVLARAAMILARA